MSNCYSIRFLVVFVVIFNGCLACSSQSTNVSNANVENKLLKDTLIHWKGADYQIITISPNDLSFFLDDGKQKFKSFYNLNEFVTQKNNKLIFAMNGGMYLPDDDNEPQGLYIENGSTRNKLDTIVHYRPIKTNFYLHPNGVFFIKKNGVAEIKTNKEFQEEYPLKNYSDIKFATQSGPMLVSNNQLHKAFTENSTNIHIRNAVGVLPNGTICFVLSEDRICFHDLATLFKEKLKCREALYLDGFVSKLYYPKLEKYRNLICGDFGVIIGVVE